MLTGDAHIIYLGAAVAAISVKGLIVRSNFTSCRGSRLRLACATVPSFRTASSGRGCVCRSPKRFGVISGSSLASPYEKGVVCGHGEDRTQWLILTTTAGRAFTRVAPTAPRATMTTGAPQSNACAVRMLRRQSAAILEICAVRRVVRPSEPRRTADRARNDREISYREY